MKLIIISIVPASFLLAGLTNGLSLLLPWIASALCIYKMQKEFDTDLDL